MTTLQKYQYVLQNYPQNLPIIQKGDMWITFDESAETISKILNIPVTHFAEDGFIHKEVTFFNSDSELYFKLILSKNISLAITQEPKK